MNNRPFKSPGFTSPAARRIRFIGRTGLLLLMGALASRGLADTYSLHSPDNTVRVALSVSNDITYAVTMDQDSVIEPSPISLTIDPDLVAGRNAQVTGVERRTINEDLHPVVREKFAVIHDRCNELTLRCQGGYSIVFRAYDNGVAYRFQTALDKDIVVRAEKAEFHFAGPAQVYFPEEQSFFSHNERNYLQAPLDSLPAGRLASLPVLVAVADKKVLVTESALRDYPGMWLNTSGGNGLVATFPHYALESKLEEGSDRNMPVTKYADFLAKTSGTRSFPWRMLALARKDADLLTNQLVYQLAEPQRITDTDWIRPGKVAWDWWNANNLYGVNFRAGINTQTYKYYIDFASRLGLEYIILDEGWYKLGDLLSPVPEVNVPELVEYGRQKHVRIILWVIWKTLDDQLAPALDQFQKWGVAGIKVDFMQRSDQWMVNYYWRIAAEAAKRKMLVDYHGAYKPCGLRRAYPNVISREGVKGLENDKWSTDVTPTHDLMLPFIRMVAGPMDFTPGAMNNAQPRNFRAIFDRPMSMGTRAHQVAMYVVYESPLQMLADSPSQYLKEMECARFIARIPTTWDETIALHGSIGQYVALARKRGDTWYLGAMTNEKDRELSLGLSFLSGGKYKAEILQDGINADHFATDYRTVTRSVSGGETLKVQLAPGGGWAAILTPEK
jgi:alpha-glucosidase